MGLADTKFTELTSQRLSVLNKCAKGMISKAEREEYFDSDEEFDTTKLKEGDQIELRYPQKA